MKVVDPLPEDIKTIKNTVTVTDPLDPTDPEEPEVVIPATHSDLSAAKAVVDASGNGFVEAGEKLTYTIAVTNNGDADAEEVIVKDDLTEAPDLDPSTVTNLKVDGVANSGNILTGIKIDVPKGTTVNVTFEVNAKSPIDADTDEIVNQAVITDPTEPETPLEPETEIPVARPDISAVKSVTDTMPAPSGDGLVEPGEKIIYTIAVKNNGNADAKGVTVKDDLTEAPELDPTSVTNLKVDGVANSGNILTGITIDVPKGATVNVTFEVNVKETITTDKVKNTATVTDPSDPTDPEKPTVTIPVGETDITAVKTVKDASGNNVAEAGEVLSYTIEVKNHGDMVANDVVVKDNLPAGLDPASVTNVKVDGALVPPPVDITTGITVDVPAKTNGVVGKTTVTFDVKVVDPLPEGMAGIKNTATITDPLDPTDPEEPEVTIPVIPITRPAGESDITATKKVTDASKDEVAQAGEVLSYTIEVKNEGDADAAGVVVKDDLTQSPGLDPATVTSLKVDGVPATGNILTGITIDVPAGKTVKVTFDVKVKDPLPTGLTTIKNVANVTDPTDPVDPTDPTDPEVVIPIDTTDISAIKTVADASGDSIVQDGELLTYSIVVKNAGDAVANNVIVKDDLEEATGLEPSTVTNTKVDGAATEESILTGISVDVPANGQVTVTFDVKAKAAIPTDVTDIKNVAMVTDPRDPSHPDKPEVTIPTAKPDITAVKTVEDASGNGFAEAGEILSYKIVVKNGGDTDAKGIVVKDDLSSSQGLDPSTVANIKIDGVSNNQKHCDRHRSIRSKQTIRTRS